MHEAPDEVIFKLLHYSPQTYTAAFESSPVAVKDRVGPPPSPTFPEGVKAGVGVAKETVMGKKLFSDDPDVNSASP